VGVQKVWRKGEEKKTSGIAREWGEDEVIKGDRREEGVKGRLTGGREESEGGEGRVVLKQCRRQQKRKK